MRRNNNKRKKLKGFIYLSINKKENKQNARQIAFKEQMGENPLLIERNLDEKIERKVAKIYLKNQIPFISSIKSQQQLKIMIKNQEDLIINQERESNESSFDS